MTLAGKLACLGLILIVVSAAHMSRLGVVAIERGGTVVTDRWTGRVYACWVPDSCHRLFQAHYLPD